MDNLGDFTPQVLLGLKEKLPDGRLRFQLVRAWDRPASPTMAREELTRQVRDGQLDAFLEVPKGILNGAEVSLRTRNTGDLQATRAIGRAINSALIARRLSDRGVHIDNLSEVLRGVDLTLVKVTKTGESEESGQSSLVQISIVMILYITLLVYGVMTMRSVVDEKTTRIVEILASSIKPSHLLTGKILGVAGVGLTQYLIWVCTAALVSAYGAAAGSAFWPGAAAPNFHLPTSYLVYPLVFFLAGYFLYASLYAVVGSMVSTEEDMQQVQMPFTLMLVGCIVLFPVIQRAPNSPLGGGLDHVSFFQPRPDGLSDNGANPALLANRPLPCHLPGDNRGRDTGVSENLSRGDTDVRKTTFAGGIASLAAVYVTEITPRQGAAGSPTPCQSA